MQRRRASLEYLNVCLLFGEEELAQPHQREQRRLRQAFAVGIFQHALQRERHMRHSCGPAGLARISHIAKMLKIRWGCFQCPQGIDVRSLPVPIVAEDILGVEPSSAMASSNEQSIARP